MATSWSLLDPSGRGAGGEPPVGRARRTTDCLFNAEPNTEDRDVDRCSPRHEQALMM